MAVQEAIFAEPIGDLVSVKREEAEYYFIAKEEEARFHCQRGYHGEHMHLMQMFER